MYKCGGCLRAVETVDIRCLYDDSEERICLLCGSTDIAAESGVKCHSCGKALFERDIAFEAGGEIFCPDCVERVMI